MEKTVCVVLFCLFFLYAQGAPLVSYPTLTVYEDSVNHFNTLWPADTTNCYTQRIANAPAGRGALNISTTSTAFPSPGAGCGSFDGTVRDLTTYSELRFWLRVLNQQFPTNFVSFVKIEMQDQVGGKDSVFVPAFSEWIEYSYPVTQFNTGVDLSKIVSPFLITAFSIDRDTTVYVDNIRLINRNGSYFVYADDTNFRFGAREKLFSWGDAENATTGLCTQTSYRPDAPEGFFHIEAGNNVWGCGINDGNSAIDVSAFSNLGFWLRSNQTVKIEIADSAGGKVGVEVPSTGGSWSWTEIPLSSFAGVALDSITWPFMLTKVQEREGVVDFDEVSFN